MMKFCCIFATLASVALASGEHDHDHGPSCACVAKDLGFEIDCGDRTSMMGALTFLLDNDCSTECSSPECAKNYYIVQAHHDYCLHDEVPEPLEDGIHDFEDTCEECSIQRKPDPLLPACPTTSCEEGNAAYSALLSAGCNSFCDTESCTQNYRILRAVHDTCPEDALSESAEAGLHDFEDPCEPYNCNPGTAGGAQQLICNEDDHDHDHDEEGGSGAYSKTATGAGMLLLGSLVMMPMAV